MESRSSSRAESVFSCTQTLKNAGYTKTITKIGLAKHEVINHGATSKLTLIGPSRRPQNPQELQRPKAMQRMYTTHKPMRNVSQRCSRTTPWRWRISRRLHKLTEHRSRCSQRLYWSYQARLLTSPQNSQQHKTRTFG